MVLYNLVNESLVLTYSDFTVRVTSVNKIQKVQFDIEQGKRGLQAVNIIKIS